MTTNTVDERVNEYHSLDGECSRLFDEGNAQEMQISFDEQQFFFSSSRCQQLSPKRTMSMCLFGVKLLYKCNHLTEYNELVAKIQGSGTEHSHADRVAELDTMLTAKCLVNRHILNGQAIEEGSFDSCKARAEGEAQVLEINLKASTVSGFAGNLTGCTMGEVTFSGQSWNIPVHPQAKSSEFELLEDYTVAVNLHDRANALPQCAGFDWDYERSVGQCGTASQCGTRNRLFIGTGGTNSNGGGGGFGGGFGGWGFVRPSDYDDVDEQHAELLCGPKCYPRWDCAGFAWKDNKCFYKRNVQCGHANDEGTCFTKRSRVPRR